MMNVENRKSTDLSNASSVALFVLIAISVSIPRLNAQDLDARFEYSISGAANISAAPGFQGVESYDVLMCSEEEIETWEATIALGGNGGTISNINVDNTVSDPAAVDFVESGFTADWAYVSVIFDNSQNDALPGSGCAQPYTIMEISVSYVTPDSECTTFNFDFRDDITGGAIDGRFNQVQAGGTKYKPILKNLSPGFQQSELAPLSLGQPRNEILTECQPFRGFSLFGVNPIPGDCVLIQVIGSGSEDEVNSVSVRTTDSRTFLGDLPQSNQRVLIPVTSVGITTVSLRGERFLPDGNAVILRADAVDFALERMSYNFATPQSGAISMLIRGCGFDPNASFSLENDDQDPIPGTLKRIISPWQAEVSFDFTNRSPAEYRLVGTKGAIEDKLDNVSVIDFGQPLAENLEVFVTGMRSYRNDSQGRLTVHYLHFGETEINAPIVRVHFDTPPGVEFDSSVRLERGQFREGNTIYFLATNPFGIPGKLHPGAKGEIPVKYRFTVAPGEYDSACVLPDGSIRDECRVQVDISVFDRHSTASLDWASQPMPPGMNTNTFDALVTTFPGTVGTTWSDYHTFFAELATDTAIRKGDATDLDALFRYAVRTALGRPGASVVGKASYFGFPIPGEAVVASDPMTGIAASFAIVDAKSEYVIDWLESGKTYNLTFPNYELFPIPEITMPNDGSNLFGVDLYADDTIGAGPPAACGNCDETGLPDRAITPPDALFVTHATWDLMLVSSFDPNEKNGPLGEGDDGPICSAAPTGDTICTAGALAGEELVEYQIHFENLGTAGAQVVRIEDDLSPGLDPTTVTFRDVVFTLREGGLVTEDTSIALDDARRESYGSTAPVGGGLSATTAMTSIGGIEVHIQAVNADGHLTWTLSTFDTFRYPDGFLPRNGQGHVSFTVETDSSLAAGTDIPNRATNFFDPPSEGDASAFAAYTNFWLNEGGAPPDTPRNPRPADGTLNAFIPVILAWESPRAETFGVTLWRVDGDVETMIEFKDPIDTRSYFPETVLSEGTRYRWQVSAKNSSGIQVDGPKWEFQTRGGVLPGNFIRGDADASDAVDISDSINVLLFLFVGGFTPACMDAADADDSGVVDLTDPINTLTFLFLGSFTPPAPGPFECGSDPTGDPTGTAGDIGCAAFAPCGS